MIVYTLTANIDEDLADRIVLQFMRNEVIQFVQRNSNSSVEYKIFGSTKTDNEGITEAFQFYFPDAMVYKPAFKQTSCTFCQIAQTIMAAL